MDMKKEALLIVVLLVLPMLVFAAPPSFHIFSGSVVCENSQNPNGNNILVNVSNGTNSFVEQVAITNNQYFVVIEADSGYNVSFYASDDFLNSTPYVPYGMSEINFSLSSSNGFCEVSSDPNTGDPSSSSTTSDNTITSDSSTTNNDDSSNDDSDQVVCGDGTCEGDETCSSCPTDCGECENWELSGPEIDLSSNEVAEVIVQGGQYELIIGDNRYSLTVSEISSGGLKVNINGADYDVPFEGSINVEVEGNTLQLSYLDVNGNKAKITVRKIELTSAENPFVFKGLLLMLLGIMVVVIIGFIILRYVNKGAGKKLVGKSAKDKNLLAGPK